MTFRIQREGGFALLIVLWSLALITLIVTQVTVAGRTEALLAGNLRRAAALRAVVDGAVHVAVFHLLDPATPWAADGGEHDLISAGTAVAVRITDEGGKINPNLAPAAMISGLIRAVGEGADDGDTLAAAIVEWRSPSAEPAGTGEKAQRYRAAGRDYAPPNAAFQTVAELGLVLGMTPELLARLAPHITLETDTETDGRLSDPVVRRALALAGVAVLAGAPPPPRVVTVTALGTAADGAIFNRRAVVSLTADRTGRPFRIVEWAG